MREYSDVVIVGAGASGLLCGGLLASHGIHVSILEKNSRTGRKLTATGNGRCNFTNRDLQTDKYYGDEKWLEQFLEGFGAGDIIRQFEKIGIFHREKDGYIYPYTNQAVTVVDALDRFCRKNGVEIVLDCKASAIQKSTDDKGYCVRTPEGKIRCRYVILATGGKAYEELGGDGSGYKLVRSLGHQVHSIVPGLTGLICSGNWWKQVAGTRVQGRFSLLINHRPVAGECGEIQITKDGVSGIPVFQLCRVAAYALAEGQLVEGLIDFVPAMGEEQLRDWIVQYGIDGLLPKKWSDFFRGRAEMEKNIKAFRFPVTSTFGIARAQVTAGGVPTDELSPLTLESHLQPGLFILGELIDVDGKCGGYNLHFAWTCACRACAEIVRREK